jgi:hypothetical protein
MLQTKAAVADDGDDFKALRAELGLLNAAVPGLGDRAVGYVAHDSGVSVLLEIKALGDKAMEPFEEPDDVWEEGAETPEERRWKALVETIGRGHAAVHRFAVVLHALHDAAGTYFLSNTSQTGDRPAWLTTLLYELYEVGDCTPYDGDPVSDPGLKAFFTMSGLAELLRTAGEPVETAFRCRYGSQEYWGSHGMKRFKGVGEFLLANAEAIAAMAPQFDAAGRQKLVEDLGRHNLGDSVFFDLTFAFAVGSSKAVRQAARPALQQADASRVLDKARETLESARVGDVRRETVELVASLYGEQARALLAAHLETEKSKPVRDVVTAALARINAAPELGKAADSAETGSVLAIDGTRIEFPPAPELPLDTLLPAQVLEPIARLIAPYNEVVERLNAAEKESYERNGWKWSGPSMAPVDEKQALSQFMAWISNSKTEDDSGKGSINEMMSRWRGEDFAFLQKPFEELLAHPDFTLWHLMRLVAQEVDQWQTLFDVLNSGDALPERTLLSRLDQGLDFRTAVQILAALGAPADAVALGVLEYACDPDDLAVDYHSLNYYFLEHLDLIDEALGQRTRSGGAPVNEKAAMQLLASLPKVPARFLHSLLDLALGGSKLLRPMARSLLAPAVGIDDAIVARLSDARKTIRAQAAEWIGARSQKQAIPVLKAALKTEKADEARAACLTALARLGEDVSEYFSEAQLKVEAGKGLAKAVAKAMEWFPFAAVPPLQWRDGGEVDPLVVKWWIVLAEKLKDPAGNAMFELYLDRLKPEDAGRFGLFLLQAFIERDTASCSEEEANESARESADQQQQWSLQYSQQNPEWARENPFVYEQAFAEARAAALREQPYSCSANRGFLGLTMRAPGPDAAALARRYLKDNGQKVNQSKALLTALARNPALAAIQAVLATANRHKQKTVQALARELIDGIAEQRGWTADELADRTIPDAGFDETGEMELECGEGRTFRAVYRGDGKIELLNPDGKTVKALPAVRNESDKEPVDASKKALSNARKEVKQVEAMQAQRLHEAMCVERSWTPEAWTSCLQRHPIVGRLCQRLAWLALDAEGGVLASFRPTEDGGLTSNADETVELTGAAAVRLAHQALLSEAESEAWLAHFGDYEVAPLFTQFGRTFPSLDDEQKSASVIEDRKGWMIDSFKLQSAAAKLGYERGDIGDGGGFDEYVKRFEGAGLRAVIAFSGSYVGADESFACALRGLSFERIGAKGRGGKTLTLAETPPVLLIEAWADFHAIAAAGSGFDEGWEKKSYF